MKDRNSESPARLEKVEGDAVSKEELWKVVSVLWTMHGPGWDEMYEDEDEDEADASV